MDEITEIFERANIQELREFLRHGAENQTISPKGHKERIDKVYDSLERIIGRAYPNTKVCEQAMDEVMAYTTELEDVYMEIGLQCGLSLATEKDKNALEKEASYDGRIC